MLLFSASLTAQSTVEKGRALYELKKYEEAARILDAVKEGTADFAMARYYLGRIAFDKKEFEDAVDYFDEATEADPRTGEFFASLGDAYAAIGANASLFRQMSVGPKAMKAWERAAELDHTMIGARYSLFGAYTMAPAMMGGGQVKADAMAKETLPLLDESLRKSPENYLHAYWYGRISAMSGLELNKGEVQLKRYVANYVPKEGEPSLAVASMRLGQIKEKQGNKSEAKKYFEIALAKDGSLKGAKEGLARVSK